MPTLFAQRIAKTPHPIAHLHKLLNTCVAGGRAGSGNNGVCKFVAQSIPYTPPALMDEIFNNLPPLLLRYYNTKIAVLYTVEMAMYLSGLGFDDVTIITREHDETIAKNSIVFGYKYILEKEAISKNMKFDCVIGNPPYQSEGTGKNRAIYHEFYYLSLNLTNRYISLITPTNWTLSNKAQFKDLRQRLATKQVEIRPLNAQQIFGVNVDMLGVVTIDISKSATVKQRTSREILFDKIVGKSSLFLKAYRGRTRQLSKTGEQGVNGKGHISLIRDEDHPYKTINRLSGKNKDIEYTYSSEIVNDHVSHFRVAWGMLSSANDVGKTHIVPPGILLTQICGYSPTNSENEADNLETYMHTKMFSFLLNCKRVHTANAIGIMRELPIVDLSRTWTDADLYEHFELTEDEILLVEGNK